LKIKCYSAGGELTRAMVKLILTDEKPKPRRLVIKADRLSKYFSDDVTDDEIEQTVIRLLEDWKIGR
jgi:ParB family chromosome partitioning protein